MASVVFFIKKNFSDVAASISHQLVEIPGLDSLGRRKRRWKGRALDFQLSLKKWIILLICGAVETNLISLRFI